MWEVWYICVTKPHHMKNFLRSMRMILARKLTPLKSVGLAFRKDKGDFKSGSKENNSSAVSRAGDGCLDKRNVHCLGFFNATSVLKLLG